MKEVKANLLVILLAVFICLVIPISAIGADKLVVKNEAGATTFKVEDNGSISSAARLFSNGASEWGSAPFVLGQDLQNRGIVITDKAASNPKNIYFGWNAGTTHDYAELFALQENVAWMNLVLAPNGGNVGIGTKSPLQPLQMGSGAYVSTGGVWTNASSRAYKMDIKKLTKDEAMDTFKKLSPVKFCYRADSEEKHVGFIAEDVPELVATKDRKGMSTMDVVAVLTKVVQEQQKTVQEHRATIAELSKRLAAVEKGVKIAKYQD